MKNQNTQYFYFDGTDSRDYGIYLSSAIKIGGAQPNVERVTIPGRSGELLRYDGSFTNVSFAAECFVRGAQPSEAIAAIAQWLLGVQGYRRLEFPWEDGFRMAYVTGAPGTECLSRGVRTFTLEFSCTPQVWTYAGQQVIQVANGDILHNEWMEAKPLIWIVGAGSGTLKVGSVNVELDLSPSGTLELDCETQNAQRVIDQKNQNSLISALEFPTLPHGKTKISWSGTSLTILRVQVVPRWWHL